MDGLYEALFSMLIPLLFELVSFWATAAVECMGSSTVDVLVLGIELLCGDCAELDRAGVGGASVASRGIVGESTRS